MTAHSTPISSGDSGRPRSDAFDLSGIGNVLPHVPQPGHDGSGSTRGSQSERSSSGGAIPRIPRIPKREVGDAPPLVPQAARLGNSRAGQQGTGNHRSVGSETDVEMSREEWQSRQVRFAETPSRIPEEESSAHEYELPIPPPLPVRGRVGTPYPRMMARQTSHGMEFRFGRIRSTRGVVNVNNVDPQATSPATGRGSQSRDSGTRRRMPR